MIKALQRRNRIATGKNEVVDACGAPHTLEFAGPARERNPLHARSLERFCEGFRLVGLQSADSGDLDRSVPPQIARYALGGGATLDWTPTAANAFQATDSVTGAIMTCVATGAYKSNTTPTTSHARCPAPAASP